MAPDNRPRSREKKIAEGEGSVKKHGSGLDSSPIQSTGGSGAHHPGKVTRGGGISLGTIILIIVRLMTILFLYMLYLLNITQ